jgi:hypothetical protein
VVPASSASISLLRPNSPTPERLDERWLDVEFVGFRSQRHGAHPTGVDGSCLSAGVPEESIATRWKAL